MNLSTERATELFRRRLQRYYEDGCPNGYIADCVNFGGREYDSTIEMILVVDGWEALRAIGLIRPDSYNETGFASFLDGAGIGFVFSDEYTEVDQLAWRTSPSSFGWSAECILIDCEYWTIDDDPHDIVRHLLASGRAETLSNGASLAALPGSFGFVRDALGFAQVGDSAYENGWHPGQTDDPVVVAEQFIQANPGIEFDAMLLDYSTGQFDIAWTMHVAQLEAV